MRFRARGGGGGGSPITYLSEDAEGGVAQLGLTNGVHNALDHRDHSMHLEARDHVGDA